MSMHRFILSVFLLSLLTACGQKGELFLPDKNIKHTTTGQQKHGTSIY
ncbi:MAG: lipoprotein [Gammaproteobacteria bacterium]|nr:lipoprotein [Gammaproteobacteria bacterium]